MGWEQERAVLSINTNMMAMTARRYWMATESALAVTTARLASGLRINSARDDPAGLAISERLLAQIRGTDVAARNANDAISRAQVGESASSSVAGVLQRMNELAVQASNGSLTSADRDLLEVEFDQLQAEVTDLVSTTKYNGATLLNNADSAAFQVGPDPGQTVTISNTDLAGLATTVSGLSLADGTGALATAANAALATALTTATTAQAAWGATQSRFDSVASNLQSSSILLTAARGRIVDADFATEAANRSRLLLLQDAATAMLAQANARPQSVLSLLLG
ncbi:MAG: flagellin [Betaproteobacteria bacterium]|jgi:flagellin